MPSIQDRNLLRRQAFIDGKWSDRGIFFPVLNPFDGKEICSIADCNPEEAVEAVKAAHRSFPGWSQIPAQQRSLKLLEVARLINEHKADLAILITLEQGKPLLEAASEVESSISLIKWLAEEGTRIHGLTVGRPDEARMGSTIRQPIGVVAAISPWNFPFYIPVQKVFSALAAGCSVVLKPAEDTPLSALAIAHFCEMAGLPQGVFNVVTSKNPEKVGEVLTTHPLVRKVAFTGSTEVGKKILAMSSTTVKKVTLELGGNCPLIVFEDANLEKAVEEAFRLKFYNAGQCCNTINRFLLHKNISKQFIDLFTKKAEQLTMGSGLEQSAIGPLINQEGKAKVHNLLADAMKKGAEALTKKTNVSGLFCSPTVLQNANQQMHLWQEEIFGPVAACYSFASEKEAIAMANDTRYGLAAYCFTEDLNRAMRLMLALEAGTVGINGTNATAMTLPYGGWKESGIGRVRGIAESLNDFCEIKSVSIRIS